MAGRSDEIKGGLKEGLGKLTGDDALKRKAVSRSSPAAARKASGGSAPRRPAP